MGVIVWHFNINTRKREKYVSTFQCEAPLNGLCAAMYTHLILDWVGWVYLLPLGFALKQI